MPEAFIGMGSNLGNRVDNLRQAYQGISKSAGRIISVSSIYETAPVSDIEQAHYLNLVVRVETDLLPRELLSVLSDLENAMGRVRTERFGPRTLDLDILLYDEQCVDTAELSLPHPRIKERAFVLVPLSEIAPEVAISGKKISELLPHVSGQEIRRTKLKLEAER